MLKTTEILARRIPAITKLAYSTEKLQSFRTTEANPSNHSVQNIAHFYSINGKDKEQLFLHGGFPKHFETQLKTFQENCLMVRKPAVDIINCLKSMDYNKPAVRFALYGKKGSGKSLTLAHVLHYGQKNNFILVHVPWVGNWMRKCRESSNSETKEGFTDLNIDAAAFLVHFKNQNSNLLKELKTTTDHVWSKRETTKKDSSLMELVELGINRIKYASDCVVVLAKEIKALSNAGKCKTLVAIDGFNAFFYPKTRILTEKKEVVHPSKVTLTEAFLELTKFDWKNAAIIVTLDEIAIAAEDQISHLPRYLLGKEGFEHLDPFVPVLVENYSEKEFKSLMDYYRERKWIQHFDGIDEEVAFVSNRNPFEVMKVCAPL